MVKRPLHRASPGISVTGSSAMMTLGVKGGEQSGQGHGGWLYRLGRRRELVPDCPWLVSRVSAGGGRRSRATAILPPFL